MVCGRWFDSVVRVAITLREHWVAPNLCRSANVFRQWCPIQIMEMLIIFVVFVCQKFIRRRPLILTQPYLAFAARECL